MGNVLQEHPLLLHCSDPGFLSLEPPYLLLPLPVAAHCKYQDAGERTLLTNSQRCYNKTRLQVGSQAMTPWGVYDLELDISPPAWLARYSSLPSHLLEDGRVRSAASQSPIFRTTPLSLHHQYYVLGLLTGP